MNLRAGDSVSAVALVVESDSASEVATDQVELPLDAEVTTPISEPGDEPEEDVIEADPTDESLLTPPEVDEEDLEP